MAALRVQDFDMLRRWVNVSRSVTESGGPGVEHTQNVANAAQLELARASV
jgi:hypothetical protein